MSPNSFAALLRWATIVWLAASGPGCAGKKAAGPDAMLVEGTAGQTPAASPAKQRRNRKPTVTPAPGVFGKVVSLNPVLRFVVMDFPVLKMPAVDQRLNVYRDGQKVGEIKVTGPMLDTTIAGDILSGEARVGDEVRDD